MRAVAGCFRGPTRLPTRARSLRALRIYWMFNGFRRPPFRPGILQEAMDLGYIEWPFRLAPWIRRAHVADIGCGNGLHAVGFLYCGAARYTGFDPVLAWRGGQVKDATGTHGRLGDSAVNPLAIGRAVPGIEYVAGEFPMDGSAGPYDVITLHNVTEHVPDLDGLFAGIRRALRDGGWVLLAHPNFYSWSGHHMRPRSVAEIDPDDPAQEPYIDWNHLTERADWPDKVRRNQNRIRIGELFRLIGRHFRIECWSERLSPVRDGRARLTGAIERAHPGFTRQDFLVKTVFCAAQRRPDGL